MSPRFPSGGPAPPFRKIAGSIRESILAGDFVPGDILPSVRALAVREGVNPNTVQAAYDLLQQEGWIERRQGAGTFVASRNPLPAAKRRDAVRHPLAAARAEALRMGLTEAEWLKLEAEIRADIPLGGGKS